MKKKFIAFLFFNVFLILFSEIPDTTNAIDETEIIKSRTGENKAGIYFKNIEQDKAVLFLDGFWDAELFASASFEFFTGYSKINSFQPIFKQKANLSLWLFLNKQFYFDILYKDDYKKSVLALGYFGKGESYIKHIRAGNSGIKFPSNYGFIKAGGGNIIAPGIMGTFAGENWNADIMLRYESAEYNSKTFYGKNEVIKTKIDINNWAKAQYFYIPVHADNLYGKTLRVFVKDYSNSDWRELPPDEFSINPREQTLALKKSFPNGAAVEYFFSPTEESDANEFLSGVKTYFTSVGGSNLIKTNITNYKTNINGKDFLLLKEKDSFSPFEIASRYNISKNKTYDFIKLIEASSENEANGFDIYINSSEIFTDNFEKITFIQTSAKDEEYSFNNPKQMFPFVNTDKEIYIPNTLNNKASSKFILYGNYIPVSEFLLNENTIPGTIHVYKNKIEIFNFNYNENTNIITLEHEILPNDLIEIQWQEGKTYSDSGTIKFAGGIHWYPIKELDIFFAGAGDWQISKQKKELSDSYKFSSGIKLAKYNITTGSEFGFDVVVNKNEKIRKQNYIFDNKTYFDYTINDIIYEKNNQPVFSNPHIYIDGNFKTISQNKSIKINSKMETSIDLWKINLAGTLSLQNKNESNTNHNNVIESYGHSVMIPVYFFNASEYFFINQNEEVLRRTCMLGFEKYAALNYLTAIDYNKEFTNQKIQAVISPIIPKQDFGILYSAISFSVNQKYKTLYNTSNLGYTKAWIKSLIDMYSEGVNNAENRNSELKIIFNLFSDTSASIKNTKLLGFNLEGIAAAKIYNSNNPQCEEETKFSISIPFEVKNIFFTPIFERKIVKQKTGSEMQYQKKYSDDIHYLFIGMGEQYWLFSKPIFYDLIDKRINKQIQLNNLHNYMFYNSYSLNISRLISTTMSDLYLPLEFNTKFSRIVKSEKSFTQASNIYSLDFLIKYTALNISGKYGYFNLFNWYDQDELNRIYKWNFSFGKEFFKFKFNSFHSLYYFFGARSRITFENDFNCTAIKLKESKIKSEEWKEKFSFSFVSESNYSLPHLIIQSFSKIKLLDSREEKFSIELSQKINSKKLNYTLSFKHSQITKIGEHGEIKLFAEFSGSSTDRNSFLLNITAGISGKVEY